MFISSFAAPDNWRKFTPNSDFSVMSKAFLCPFIIVEIVSQPQDRYRMLVEGVAAVRAGQYLSNSDTHRFFMVAIYLTADLHAEWYILTEGGSGSSNKQVHHMIALHCSPSHRSDQMSSLQGQYHKGGVWPWKKGWRYPISSGNVQHGGDNRWTRKRAWWKEERTFNHHWILRGKNAFPTFERGIGTEGRAFPSRHPGGGLCPKHRGSRWSRSVSIAKKSVLSSIQWIMRLGTLLSWWVIVWLLLYINDLCRG